MRKGISPIVAVVLLIAIAVIAAVGLYFWVGGLATKQPTPSTPGTITAICSGSNHVVTISNTGTTDITTANLDNSMTTGTISLGSSTCPTTLGSGDSCVYGNASSGAKGFVYGSDVAQAQFNC